MARTTFNIDKLLRVTNELLPPERRPDLRIGFHGTQKKKAVQADEAFQWLSMGELKSAETLPGRDSRLTDIICQLANPGGEIRHYTPKKK